MGLCDTCKEDKETRECYIQGCGLCQMCCDCAYAEHLNVAMSGNFDFSAWIAQECDGCRAPTAFKGPIKGYPDGVRCDTCKNPTGGPVWICVFCLVQKHRGHKFTSWGPSELDIILQQIEGYI